MEVMRLWMSMLAMLEKSRVTMVIGDAQILMLLMFASP
jgi:hypothetical protein